jgi:hypothetical protein
MPCPLYGGRLMHRTILAGEEPLAGSLCAPYFMVSPGTGGIILSEQNTQVVLNFIEAMGRGDAAAAAPCITEDACTQAKGFGKFAGVRTRETILATIDALSELMPGGMEPDIISITAENDRVVVEFEGNGNR